MVCQVRGDCASTTNSLSTKPSYFQDETEKPEKSAYKWSLIVKGWMINNNRIIWRLSRLLEDSLRLHVTQLIT